VNEKAVLYRFPVNDLFVDLFRLYEQADNGTVLHVLEDRQWLE